MEAETPNLPMSDHIRLIFASNEYAITLIPYFSGNIRPLSQEKRHEIIPRIIPNRTAHISTGRFLHTGSLII